MARWARGNTTASAEFNIWQDPEAARIVLDCGRPLTLMPLDVTHQALFGPAELARLDALETRLGRSSRTCSATSPGSTRSATAGTGRRSTMR